MAEEVSVIEYIGTPIAKVGRYSGSALTYQDVVSWTVASGHQGVLFEVEMVSSNYNKTMFRLTIRKKSLTGTLTFTLGSATVTGSGTAFTSELEVGDEIILDADEVWAEVQSIESNISLTLTAVYAGAGGSGAGSKVWGFSGKQIQAALSLPWKNNKLAAGTVVKLQAESTDGTAIVVDGSITGTTLGE
jgi:hypothetical protein